MVRSINNTPPSFYYNPADTTSRAENAKRFSQAAYGPAAAGGTRPWEDRRTSGFSLPNPFACFGGGRPSARESAWQNEQLQDAIAQHNAAEEVKKSEDMITFATDQIEALEDKIRTDTKDIDVKKAEIRRLNQGILRQDPEEEEDTSLLQDVVLVEDEIKDLKDSITSHKDDLRQYRQLINLCKKDLGLMNSGRRGEFDVASFCAKIKDERKRKAELAKATETAKTAAQRGLDPNGLLADEVQRRMAAAKERAIQEGLRNENRARPEPAQGHAMPRAHMNPN